MDILAIIMLSAALLIATITDLRSQRIPNWLTFTLILSGFAAHFVFGGLDGLKIAGGGFGVGFIAMAIPFFLGAMGAGDVKLMAGIGAWLGAPATMTAFMFTCIAGGLYALVLLVFRRDIMKAVLANVYNVASIFVATRKFNFSPTANGQAMPRLCYGVAIAAGTLLAIGLHISINGSIYGN